jgi:hypothetical protein
LILHLIYVHGIGLFCEKIIPINKITHVVLDDGNEIIIGLGVNAKRINKYSQTWL